MHRRSLFDRDVKHIFETADLARWSGGTWCGVPTTGVTGFSIDTRTLQPGDLFIALRGERADGHRFAADAIRRGAAGVMVSEKETSLDEGMPCLRVSDPRNALMNLARGYRSTLRCRMTAVTGSVGKTTVKELAADMLAHAGVTARTRGNWNNDLGLPLSLLSTLPDASFGVFEVGMNQPGELEPLCSLLAPDVGVVTCVGPVHIEHFSDEQGIADEKASVYRSLPPDGVAVLNADGAYIELLRKAAAHCRRVEVSVRKGADYVYRRLEEGRRFVLDEKSTGDSVELTASLPGGYFVLDAALAAAVARTAGVPWSSIRLAVESYRPLSMRWNRQTLSGVLVVNDAYNANPLSLKAAVEAFQEESTPGTRWLVLGGMRELGDEEEALHRAVGAMIAGHPELRLVTVGARGAWLAGGAAEAGMEAGSLHRMTDHEQAAHFLRENVREGDAVLFKGSRGECLEKVLERWQSLLASHAGANPS